MTASSPLAQPHTHVKEFDVYDLQGGTGGHHVHFEIDGDLEMQAKRTERGGTRNALVLIELGIDGSDLRSVRMDTRPGGTEDQVDYLGRELLALTHALEALQTARDTLAAMQAIAR